MADEEWDSYSPRSHGGRAFQYGTRKKTSYQSIQSSKIRYNSQGKINTIQSYHSSSNPFTSRMGTSEHYHSYQMDADEIAPQFTKRTENPPTITVTHRSYQNSTNMDAFLEAFFALDDENREVISLNDLRTYNRRNNLEDSFPETFMSVFDKEKSGTITLDQYCRTLGLVPKNARDFRQRRTTQLLEELTPPDLEMVHDDMDLNIKLRIYQILLDDLREAGRDTNINVAHLDTAVKKLKKYLETRHGRGWQIIISINQQLAWFNYLPGFMLHFCLGRFAVLIWKTPAQ